VTGQGYLNFLDRLSTLLNAGVPIRQALNQISSGPDARSAGVARLLEEKIGAGATLADALDGLPEDFPAAHRAVIGAAERAGQIPEALVRLRAEVERRLEMVRSLVKRGAYPVVVLALVPILCPLFLLVQGNVGSYLMVQLLVFGPGFALAALAKAKWRTLLAFLARFPLIGGAIRRGAAGESLSLLGLLVGAGVGLRESLDLAAGAARNPELAARLARAAGSIDRGKNLAESLAGLPGLPPDEHAGIATGEYSGAMDKALAEAGRTLEDGARRTIERIAMALPVILYLLAGLVVGVIYVNTMLNYFSAAVGE